MLFISSTLVSFHLEIRGKITFGIDMYLPRMLVLHELVIIMVLVMFPYFSIVLEILKIKNGHFFASVL